MVSYFIGAYWRARKETLEECLKTMISCLEKISTLDPELKIYFYATPKKEIVALENFLRLQMMREVELAEGDDLGFKARLKITQDGKEWISVSFRCGLYNSTPGMSNYFLIDPVKPGNPFSDKIFRSDFLEALFRVLATELRPDWITIISNSYIENYCPNFGKIPGFCWLIYLSKEFGLMPPLPSNAKTSAVDNLGTLITIFEEAYDPNSSIQANFLQEVNQILSQSNILRTL